MNHSNAIREPAVAGAFYPGQPDELAGTVDDMLDRAAPAPLPTDTIRALICPHAGYVFSGAVAAAAYSLVRGATYHTVVVISPSHLEFFDYSAVYDGAAYRTPLGDVPVNTELSARIAAAGPATVSRSRRGHACLPGSRGEHALEVQLPFVQRALPGARIVPIVMGDQRIDRCEDLGAALSPILDDAGILLVASSDLSHFHDRRTARVLDDSFVDAFLTADPRRVFEAVEAGRCEACGAGPVAAALAALEHRPGKRAATLARADSGDAGGDLSRVVGYFAGAVTESTRA